MANVKILDAEEMTLQMAVCRLRNELVKKDSWYEGFVASIGSSLRESGVYEPDIEDIARRVLNRIVGLEDENAAD